MATKKLTNIQEATDFVRGCTFYATGGGAKLMKKALYK